MKYNKQYFIDKVNCHCMMGHLGAFDWKHTEESLALTKILKYEKTFEEYDKKVGDWFGNNNIVIYINDMFESPNIKSSWLKILYELPND